MLTKLEYFFKKPLFCLLIFFVNFFIKIFGVVHSIFFWLPTSPLFLEQSETKLIKFLRNQPDCYFVEIGSGWSSNSNKIWTLEFNINKVNRRSSLRKFRNSRISFCEILTRYNKTPVVFIHGLASGSAIWLLNFDEIFENGNRKLFAIDLLGFGRSSKPDFKLSHEIEWDLVHSIERWRRAVGLEEKFILVGHEFGAYLSLSYGFHFPEFVSHIVLVDSWGIPSQQQALQSRTVSQYSLPYWVKLLDNYVFKFLSPFDVLRFIGPYGFNILKTVRSDLLYKYKKILTEENANLIVEYIYHCNVQPKRSGEQAFKALCLPYGWAKYPIIHRVRDLSPDINLTFIFGSRSWVDRQPAFQVKYLLGEERVSVNVIQGAGHHVYADKPEEFNELVNAICNSVDNVNNQGNNNLHDNNSYVPSSL